MIEKMIGKVFTEVKVSSYDIEFIEADGSKFVMYHNQDCCEEVYIEDICGDINDLVNAEILSAEESSNRSDEPLYQSDDSYTWTFYRFQSTKGPVVIRWYGSSNGYYSESVDVVYQPAKVN